MNERILELARQVWPDPNTSHVNHEKFAQLIVRECLAQADNIREGCEVDGEDKQALGADWVGLAIARHFGVEP